ncbi:MAG: hypothetical protein SPK50_06205 [Mobiluncus porci]|uniref:hypothetical protein n=1 Tax=Mobiluncus TaxID=2050 RepID=UPI0023F581F0|nr:MULTISPECIES: hypothetical protein [Mobiluncus]MCI6584438.1 hypothetical protein [Mobiluncus sp.]MDD7541857.1 hypothetical protein [Mobiluncus porci]MDY5748705.1 hypothetical protein [Mobiluncus porci]
MDEKRELLMKLLFGNDDEDQANGTTPAVDPARIQRWAKAQEKAQKINQTLDNSERSADILREMMRDN